MCFIFDFMGLNHLHGQQRHDTCFIITENKSMKIQHKREKCNVLIDIYLYVYNDILD